MGWGVGARELPLALVFLIGFVLPFVGGGVTEVDQCLMLLMYAAANKSSAGRWGLAARTWVHLRRCDVLRLRTSYRAGQRGGRLAQLSVG